MPTPNELNTQVDEEKVIPTDSEETQNTTSAPETDNPILDPSEVSSEEDAVETSNNTESSDTEVPEVTDSSDSSDETVESEEQKEEVSSTDASEEAEVSTESETGGQQEEPEVQPESEATEETATTEEVSETEPSVAEESKEETKEAENSAEKESTEVEEEASSESEGEASESSTLEVSEDLVPLLSQIDEALEDKSKLALENANAADLTRLLLSFGKMDDIRSLFPRVGFIKRSFDAIDAEQIDEDAKLAFDTALDAFNKRRKDHENKQDVAKADNLEKKKEILVKLQEVVDSGDASRIQDVRAIQDAWKNIGQVPKDQRGEIQKSYRSLLDNFYRISKTHFELLEYDRKKNLVEKEKLIKEAEELSPTEGSVDTPEAWKISMDRFKEIQRRWRAAGHVPREDMDRINTAYRTAIDKFFEIRQGFMDEQDKLRGSNGEKKQEILEKMAPFSTFEAVKPREWNDATRELRGFQDQWNGIGQGPIKINNDLWNRYREICNAFFTRKSAFFKKYDDLRAENLVKKRELCEKAEGLKDSDNWEKSAKQLKQMQRDWKEIGPVPERYSNKLWNRFREACDQFFEARRSHYSTLHAGEMENLEKKKALIEEVKKIDIEEAGGVDEAIGLIKNLQAAWKEIGKVPFKEKDKIWEEFRAEIDKFFNGLSGRRNERRFERTKASFNDMKDMDQRSRGIHGRIQRIRRSIRSAQEKIDQYSTNIQFISKGKSGDALRAQIQGEIDKEIETVANMKKEIKELNEMLKNPPPAEEEKKEAAAAPAEVTEVKEEEKAEAPAEESPAEDKAEVAEAEKVKEEVKETAEAAEVEEAPTAEAEATEEAAVEEEANAETKEEEAEAASEEGAEKTPAKEASEEEKSEE